MNRIDGEELLEKLLARCTRNGPEALTTLSPPFAAVFYSAPEGTATVAVDRSGLQHLYELSTDGATWITSSALSLASLGTPKLSVDAAVEWLSVGHFISQRTLFRDIRKLGCGERVVLDHGTVRKQAEWAPTFVPGAERDVESSHVAAFIESIDVSTPEDGVASELTGGLDSRLLLAGLVDRRRFFAWTMGQPGCGEVRTVERLRERLSFSHMLVPIDCGFIDRLPELVPEMHALSDGETNSLEYAPLLVAFEHLAGHRSVSISGTGGEIARGFYYRAGRLPRGRVRGVSVDGLIEKLTRATRQLQSAVRTDVTAGGVQTLRDLVGDFIRASPGTTPEEILDDFYLRCRMQRFGGRNVTMTGHFCMQGLPYFGNSLVDASLGLPTRAKRGGWIARRSLMRLSPTLASVPLDSGAPVCPVSWRRPDIAFKRYVALAEKATRKFGGSLGRSLVRSHPPTIPWGAATTSDSFREYCDDLLFSPQAQVCTLVQPAVARTIFDTAFGGEGSVYELGMLLTLELTLRRTGASF